MKQLQRIAAAVYLIHLARSPLDTEAMAGFNVTITSAGRIER